MKVTMTSAAGQVTTPARSRNQRNESQIENVTHANAKLWDTTNLTQTGT